MFNNRYGVKLDAGYDRITDDQFKFWNIDGGASGSLPFKTNYYRVSLQGIMDLGRIMKFENFAERLSLLFHTGVGLSQMRRASDTLLPQDNLKDNMLNFIFGLTSNKITRSCCFIF